MLTKTTTLLLIGVYLSLFTNAQIENKVPPPKVDQRIELLGIVFRLAGNHEYTTEENKKYVLDIHRHFDPFKNHPLIQYARLLRDSNGIAYDAVMDMAIHLKQPPELDPIVPFSTDLPNKRWSLATAEKFTTLLKQFYKDADCKTFFDAQKANYQLTEDRFQTLNKDFDVNWYYQFYGKAPSESFHLIIGLGNGVNNYGPHMNLPGNKREVYAILGAQNFDDSGAPVYENRYLLATLIHEFNHSFVNSINDLNLKQLHASGEIIFEKERTLMVQQQYKSWKTMMDEALVRAAVVRYLVHHNQDTLIADREIKTQLANGFVWIRGLVNELDQYEKQRNKYANLESFMPEIIRFYDQVAPRIDFYDQVYLNACGRVLSVEPFKNKDSTVTPGITEIRFNFDRRLGKRYFFGPGEKGMSHYPKILGFSFSADNKTIIMKFEPLQPNTEYQINMIGRRMRTEDEYPLQNYLLTFKTAGSQ